jgi:hypothetical protein
VRYSICVICSCYSLCVVMDIPISKERLRLNQMKRILYCIFAFSIVSLIAPVLIALLPIFVVMSILRGEK